MILVRDVFRARYGKAGELVEHFKKAPQSPSGQTNYGTRVLTDASGPFFTVVTETEVASLGEGTRVAVKLRDKKKVIGHINYTGDDFFVVTEEKTQTSQKLTYADVDEIKLKKEGGFPRKGKIALGILGVLMVMGLATNGGG